MRMRPSQTSRWMQCPGSLVLSIGLPEDPSSQYAREGTLAHNVIEMCQRLGVRPDVFIGQTFDVEGHSHQVTEEMANAVTYFLDFVADMPGEVLVETLLLSADIPQLYGTVDYVAVTDKRIWIVDYKHGQGVPVDAIGNKQLLSYAVLVSELFGPRDEVFLTIIQPRAYDSGDPVKTWETDGKEVAAHRERILHARSEAERIRVKSRQDDITDELTINAGCRWCPATAHCPKLRQHAQQIATMEFSDPDRLSMDDMQFWLQHASVFRAWLDAVKQYATELALRGETIPGHKLVEAFTNRQWVDDENGVVRALLEHGFDVDSCFEKSLRTPAQVAKHCPPDMTRAHAARLVDDLVTRQSKGVILVDESDRRPPAMTTMFEKVDV